VKKDEVVRLSFSLVVTLAGCTLRPTQVPPLTGPSELGMSFNVTATPDSLTQNTYTSSAIVVTALGPNGEPVSGLDFRLALQPLFGTLSSSLVRTGSDGKATAIYTAPLAPPFVFGKPATLVRIAATPVGGDHQASISQHAAIEVSPPPLSIDSGSPTASVTFSPASPRAGELVNFDATSSQAAIGHAIVSYFWDFGDGLPQDEEGFDASHIYLTAGTYTMVLGVVDDVGRKGSIFKTIVVSQ
jgi:PKD repeat protein